MKTEYTKKVMRPATGKKTKPDEIEAKDVRSKQNNDKGGERKV